MTGCGSSTRYSSIPCGVGLYSVSIVFRLCATYMQKDGTLLSFLDDELVYKKCSTRYYTASAFAHRALTHGKFMNRHIIIRVCAAVHYYWQCCAQSLAYRHSIEPPHDTGISTTDEVRPQEYFLLQQNYSPSGWLAGAPLCMARQIHIRRM